MYSGEASQASNQHSIDLTLSKVKPEFNSPYPKFYDPFETVDGSGYTRATSNEGSPWLPSEAEIHDMHWQDVAIQFEEQLMRDLAEEYALRTYWNDAGVDTHNYYQLAENFSAVDYHDHQPGRGASIPPFGGPVKVNLRYEGVVRDLLIDEPNIPEPPAFAFIPEEPEPKDGPRKPQPKFGWWG